jgi:hypothetical protein
MKSIVLLSWIKGSERKVVFSLRAAPTPNGFTEKKFYQLHSIEVRLRRPRLRLHHKVLDCLRLFHLFSHVADVANMGACWFFGLLSPQEFPEVV